MPMELQGLTTTGTSTDIYALCTRISAISFVVIGVALSLIIILQKRRSRLGSDAGKGV